MSESNPSRGKSLTDLSESDLSIFDALQAKPRASWAEIGRRVGVSAATVSRRWQRLENNGVAWISTYPGFMSGVVRAIVLLKCDPIAAETVAVNIRLVPEVLTLTMLTGTFDLQLTMFADTTAQLRSILNNDISAVNGVSEMHVMLISEVFREGGSWKVGALAEKTPGPSKINTISRLALNSQAQIILSKLERNGRTTATDIAQAIGSSEPHARRVIHKLIQDGVLTQRVDLASEQTTWPHALVLWLECPAAKLLSSAARISLMPSTRLCSSVLGGTANLLAIIWLRSLEEASEIEATVLHGLDIRVVNRQSILHYHKRMGHLFESDGSYAGHIPWVSDRRSLQDTPTGAEHGSTLSLSIRTKYEH